MLGSVGGTAITSFGVIAVFATLQPSAGTSVTVNSLFTGIVISGVLIAIGAFILCKSATSAIGRWIAGLSAVVAVIACLYSIFTSSTPSNFIGGAVILLLAGLLFWTTRSRRW